MRLAEVVEASREVASTRKRLRKIEVLADLLRRMTPEEALVAGAWLAGETRQGRFGVGGAAIRAARCEPASSASVTVAEVDAVFQSLVGLSGPGSSKARVAALKALLERATGDEQDFLAGLLFGELRQGALEGIMIEALARACALPAADVRRAVMLCGVLWPVAAVALRDGAAGLARFQLRLFRPLQPMLAETAADPSEALGRLGCAAFEFKMDGARVQVHRSGDEVRVFTRGLNEVTSAVPELVSAALSLDCREAVLDGEIIALREDGRPYPFQVTMRRFGSKVSPSERPLSTFFFDLIHLDGRTLLEAPTSARFAELSALVPASMLVPRLVTAEASEADGFLARALDCGHEGVMAKALDAPYEAGSRGQTWLKIKSAHTLDLVVLAAEWGSGRRRGWLSNLHLGARDPATGGFVMLGKTFKGMTDAILEWQTRRLQEIEVRRDDWTVYVRPELVVEVAVSDVQTSPHYPGGMALRFARLKRYREDKRPEEADTVETVRRIHQSGS